MGVKDELHRGGRGRSKGNGPRPTKARFNDVQFVQLEPDKEELLAIKNSAVTPEDVLDFVTQQSEAGYRISHKYDDFSEAHAVYCQPLDDDHENSGLVMSGRGSSAFKALRQLMWKFSRCPDGQWPRPDFDKRAYLIDD